MKHTALTAIVFSLVIAGVAHARGYDRHPGGSNHGVGTHQQDAYHDGSGSGHAGDDWQQSQGMHQGADYDDRGNHSGSNMRHAFMRPCL